MIRNLGSLQDFAVRQDDVTVDHFREAVALDSGTAGLDPAEFLAGLDQFPIDDSDQAVGVRYLLHSGLRAVDPDDSCVGSGRFEIGESLGSETADHDFGPGRRPSQVQR